MALRRSRSHRWALLAAPLLVLAFLWAQPTQAFGARIGDRSVNASIVAPANAYTSASLGSCTSSRLLAYTCTLTITNKGTASVAYTVARDADSTPPMLVSVSGSPTASVSPGSSGSVTLNFNACGVGCAPGTYSAWVNITAANAGVLNALQAHHQVNMTITV